MLHLFKKTTAVLLVISMLLGALCLPTFASNLDASEKEETTFNYWFNDTKPEPGTNYLYQLQEIPEEGDLASLPPLTEGYTHVQVGSNLMSKYALAYNYLSEPNKEDGEKYFAFYDKHGNKYYTSSNAYTDFYSRGCAFEGVYVFDEKTGKCEYLTIGNGITMNMDNASIKDYHDLYPDQPVLIPARFESVQQFVLADAQTGKYLTAYCCDKLTTTKAGYCYYMENLEDAEYYPDEQAAHIRAIAWNGYWGLPFLHTAWVQRSHCRSSERRTKVN